MDSNKHVHATEPLEPPKAQVSGFYIIGALVGLAVVIGVLVMGYNLVREELNLTEYQAFVSVVLGGITTLTLGILGKISLDKKADREFKKWQIQKTLEHEEIIEKTRMNTNGRLHKRDDRNRYQNKLKAKLHEKIVLLESWENTPEQEKALIKLNGDIAYLEGQVNSLEEEVADLKPLYPKE
jgi:hypothetical protein